MRSLQFNLVFLVVLHLLLSVAAPAGPVTTLAQRKVIPVGTRPESVARGFGGKLYVTVMNDSLKAGDGLVRVVDGEAVKDFASGFDEPKGIAFTGKYLVVADLLRVWRIDETGAASVLAEAMDFPRPIAFLNDVALEPGGQAVFVVDTGAVKAMRDSAGNLWPVDSQQARDVPAIGHVYRIGLIDGKVTLAVDASPDMRCPNGVAAPAKSRLLVSEFFLGNIFDIRRGEVRLLASGLRGADGIEQDHKGNIYISSWTQGTVWKLDRHGRNRTVILEGLQSAADFYLDEKANQLIVPDMKAGTLNFIPLR